MTSEPPSVCAVVLTHARPDTLEICLDRLAAQSRRPDHVLVVDNGSTDRTAALLATRSEVEVLRLETNTGATGGFARGLRAAAARQFDWVWLLDDDAWPEPGCLGALLDGIERAPAPPSLMTSSVRWTNGRLHPMNRPWPRMNRRGEFAAAAERRLVAVRGATWVSTMVSRAAIERHPDLPEHYVLWVDDTEWTARVLRHGVGYLVPESVCVHATASLAGPADGSGERFYFKARNSLWLLRAGRSLGGLERLFYALGFVSTIRRYIRQSDSRREALRIVARGIRDGLKREPR